MKRFRVYVKTNGMCVEIKDIDAETKEEAERLVENDTKAKSYFCKAVDKVKTYVDKDATKEI